jgi:hypothetical protein
MYLWESEGGLTCGGLTGRICGPVEWLDTCRMELMDSSRPPPCALCREDEDVARVSRLKLTDLESCRGEDMPVAPAVTCTRSIVHRTNSFSDERQVFQFTKFLTGRIAAVPSGRITRL